MSSLCCISCSFRFKEITGATLPKGMIQRPYLNLTKCRKNEDKRHYGFKHLWRYQCPETCATQRQYFPPDLTVAARMDSGHYSTIPSPQNPYAIHRIHDGKLNAIRARQLFNPLIGRNTKKTRHHFCPMSSVSFRC